MNTTELIDLIDADDHVIGITDLTTAHQQGLFHRVAAVFVFTPEGKLYLQQHKESGEKWDNSVGGHVRKSESYREAAIREMQEELHVVSPLHKISIFLPSIRTYNHYYGLFESLAPSNWIFTPTEEVSVISAFTLEEITQRLNQDPTQFTRGFLNTFTEYIKQKHLNLL